MHRSHCGAETPGQSWQSAAPVLAEDGGMSMAYLSPGSVGSRVGAAKVCIWDPAPPHSPSSGSGRSCLSREMEPDDPMVGPLEPDPFCNAVTPAPCATKHGLWLGCGAMFQDSPPAGGGLCLFSVLAE